ncbi:MAG: hypothetical protein FJ295_16190 [Planctomycetes bacterium]|nr:hypothetical protein [Planctomycetota bacterium]
MRKCLRLAALPMRSFLAFVFTCVFTFTVAVDLSAQVPTPQLTSVFPPGASQGAALDLAVAGADLDESDRLIFSHSGILATAKFVEPTEFSKARTPVAGSYRVTVARDVPPGNYEVRAISRFGISNPRMFVVSAVEELQKTADNNQPEKAMEIPIGPVVNGRATANARDFYKVNLQAGQRVLIECQAQQIDSRMDATLVLYGPDRKEIVRNRDFRNADPLIDFTPPVAGSYTIAVYDFVYAGGPDHFYRLSVHTRPYVDFVFPPSGRPGTTSMVTVYGRNLPFGQPDEQLKVAGASLQKLTMPVAFPADASSELLAVDGSIAPRASLLDATEFRVAGTIPQLIHLAQEQVISESEPNNGGSAVQSISIPCELVGQFYPAADVDVFQFDAKKDQVFAMEVLAHRLGLNCDPLLQVQRVIRNEKGEETLSEIATADDPGDRNNRIGSDFDTSTDDPTVRFTAPEDGVYRLVIRDQFGGARNDSRYIYRVVIRALTPDFRLVAVPQPLLSPPNPQVSPLGASVVRRGGTSVIPVLIDRRDDFRGEVQLSVEGLPHGVSAPSVIAAADATSVQLVLVATENAESWVGPVWIVGRSKVGEREVLRQARVGACVWGTGNRQAQLPEFRATRQLILAVCGKDLDPALVQSEDKVWETSLGGTLTIPINLTRRGEYKEAVKLVASGLPGEIKPGELNLDANTATANLAVPIANQNTKPGVYTFSLRSDSKFKHVRNPDAIRSAEEDQQLVGQLQTQADAKLKETTAAKDGAVKAAEESVAGMKQAEQAKTTAATAAQQTAEASKAAAEKLAVAKDAAGKDTTNQALADAAAAAQKAADEAAAAAKSAAEQAAVADKNLAEAQAKAKAAEEAKVKAEQAAKEAQDKLNLLNQKKQEVDKRVNDTKQANQPKDLTFAIVSTPIKIRVVPTPIAMTSPAPVAPVKQGAKGEVALKIERRYGFAEDLEVTFEAPQGVAITAAKTSVPGAQADARLEVVVDKAVAPGDHACTVRAKGKFNNVNIEGTLPVTLKIEKAE